MSSSDEEEYSDDDEISGSDNGDQNPVKENKNIFSQFFDFSKSIFAQKIYCIIGILILGLLFKFATNSGTTKRSQFLIFCVWAWIWLLIAIIVINFALQFL